MTEFGGILGEADTGEKAEISQSRNETVLIFGQGPVIAESKDRVNYWSLDLAHAATILKKYDPSVTNFVVMGGKTGGVEHASEADLIAQKMVEGNIITRESIATEEESNDTIENIVNFLNLYDKNGSIDRQKLSILCAPFHSNRVRALLQLFTVPIDHSFQSTEVIRYAARVPDGENSLTYDPTKWNEKLLQEIEDKIDINHPTKFSSKQDHVTEQRDVADRYMKDDLYLRELLEYPEKWLPYIGKLHNPERIKSIFIQIENLFPHMLSEKYGITIPEDFDASALAQIKTSLAAIPRYMGLSDETIHQWVEQNKTGEWPPEVKMRLENILKAEKQNKST